MTVVFAMRCADGLVLAATPRLPTPTELGGMFDANPTPIVEAVDVGHGCSTSYSPDSWDY